MLMGAAILVGAALSIMLGVRVYAELAYLQRAPHDNIQWTVAQLETEILRLRVAAGEALAGDDARLEELRKRFDIFYSRVTLIRSGSVFAPLREDAAVSDALNALHAFLIETAPLIDGPDEALRAGVPDLIAQSDAHHARVRRLALAGLEMFARSSDAFRREFASLVRLTAFAALVVFVLLLIAGAGLAWQMRRSQRRAIRLRSSERRLAAMVNSALDAVIMINQRAEIIEYNPAAETTFGFRRDAAIGRSLIDLIMPERDRPLHQARIRRFIETGVNEVVNAGRLELTALNATGEEFPIEYAVGSSEGEDGPIFVVYLRDVTRQRSAEQDLRDALARAEGADRAKSHFISVMSHEMRTPLNGILGAVDMMRASSLDEGQSRYLDLILMSGEILQRHVETVLDIGSIEAGKMRIIAEPFDPAALARDLAELMSEDAGKRNNRLTLDIDPQVERPFLGDSHRVRQVLLNILSNGNKFTSGGQVAIEVRLAGGTEEAPVIEFGVRDEGIGIARADLPRLFEDFVVLSPAYSREVGGAGLGLAICRRVVHALGGEIGVETNEGHGSHFWFRIPVAPAGLPPSALEPARPVLAATTDGLASVLLVEDNAISRTIAEEMLRAAGCEVVTARNSLEAIGQAERRAFDLILMDISMPGMDGVEATRRIREGEGASKRSKIVALTAHALPEEVERFLRAGMQDCLVKPLRQADLRRFLVKLASEDFDDLPTADGMDQRTDMPMATAPSPKLDASAFAALQSELGAGVAAAVVEAFRKELADAYAEIQAAMAAGDIATMQRLAHQLHGGAASIGATDLAMTLEEVELRCKQGELEQARRALGAVGGL